MTQARVPDRQRFGAVPKRLGEIAPLRGSRGQFGNDVAFDRAWDEGAAMSLREIGEYGFSEVKASTP